MSHSSNHQPRNRRDCLGQLTQIDGSDHAWFSAFLVGLGAAMIVASTIVLVPTFRPLACKTSATLANSASPS